MTPKISAALRSARKLSASELTNALPSLETAAPQHNLEVKYASEVPKTVRGYVWDLYATNMRTALKNSSFGWDPSEKKEEIFHKLGRLLLITSSESGDLVAFASFRYDVEPNSDEVDEDVLYLYEVQVAASARNQGLGMLIMQSIDALARKGKMYKVMLTVLANNPRAIRLYSRAGMLIDPNSPVQEHEDIGGYPATENTAAGNEVWEDDWSSQESSEGETPDYLILSKIVVSTSVPQE